MLDDNGFSVLNFVIHEPSSLLIILMNINTNILLQVRPKNTRKHTVRFEETSFAGPSASSDPIEHWSERSFVDRPIKPSRSCEVFTVYTPHRRFD